MLALLRKLFTVASFVMLVFNFLKRKKKKQTCSDEI